MAGFSGMPLGSFSGRGADFQPFQFIMQLRQRQAEQEQARKEQAQAAQQSFLMAVMSQKQQQQAMQQRQQEAMMQRSLEEQNQARLADQFRSEQSRLQGAEQRRIEMERETLGFQKTKAAELDASRRADDEYRAKLAAKKDQDTRNLMGVSSHVTSEAENAFAAATKGPDMAALQKEYEDSAREAGRSGSAAVRERHERAKQALAAAKSAGPVDGLDAVERATTALRAFAAQIPDPQAKALYLAQIAEWREGKRAEVLKDQQVADYRQSRADAKAEREESRKLRGSAQELSALKAELGDIEDELDDAEGDLDAARVMKRPDDEVKSLATRVDELRKRRIEIRQELRRKQPQPVA